MLPIYKNATEPLRQHRSQSNATYDNISEPDREKLVQSLLHEQGYLCAYCMCRIKAPLVKVEHWKCRDKFPELQLEYSNLLAVCCGNSGQNASHTKCEDKRGVTPHHQHCDTRKGNSDLAYNPADPAHHARLQINYIETTGLIKSKDEKLNDELSSILNLNIEYLKSNRVKVLQVIKSKLASREGSAKQIELETLLNDWKSLNKEGKLKEFAGVSIWYLEKRIKSARN